MSPVSNEKFRFETALRAGKKIVLLFGSMDEDSDLQQLKELGNGPLVFNFKAVNNINSCGTRNWVNFLKEMGDWPFSYEECSPVVVRQMNMVPSFVGRARILSMYVPYLCNSCDQSRLLLYAPKGGADTTPPPEQLPCEKCQKGVAELDGKPKHYTHFFSNTR